MTPIERLLAEELPTGTFGHAQPPRRHARPIRPWTAEEQAQHLADLNAALEGWQDPGEHAARDRARHRPAHLRVVEGTSGSEAAA